MKFIGSKFSSTKERNVEKRILLYRWLNEFRYVEANVVANLLDVGLRQAQIFLKNLYTEGFIDSKKIAISLTKTSYIYFLTHKGYKQWVEIEPTKSEQKFRNQKRALNSSLLRHNIMVQDSVFNLMGLRSHILREQFQIHGESFFDDSYKGGRRPDAHISYKKGEQQINLVLEYEGVVKSSTRVQWILLQHLKQMLEGRYDIVYFYFSNESARNIYERHFKAKNWPVINKVNYHYVLSKSHVKAWSYGDLSERFYFKVSEFAKTTVIH